MSNLKDNVLDLAVNQINNSKVCDIYDLQYSNKKSGKKIIGFEFTYKIRKPLKKLNESAQSNEIPMKMTDAQRHLFGVLGILPPYIAKPSEAPVCRGL